MKTMARFAIETLAVGALLVSGVALGAQKISPADAAARLTGTWTLNRELSPGFRAPGARPGGPGRGGLRFAMASMPQRGGGNTPMTASDLSPAELAAQAAMRQLQQIADEIRIDATAERVTFTDARGERSYTIDNKNAKITVAGAEVSTKSRWDRTVLRQEFSTASTKLTQTWDVDADGRLVLTAKLESLRLRTPDQKAVFDRKP
jgi:hypothetical protein